ncbi:MAG: hypothetical protein DRP16_04500 [Candidatus Aenigmatarchaeota archaeon]|nr:MAG: hypothetical protein DRP16_04500 [Candidatus Aenigmarchaeota archaeon]
MDKIKWCLEVKKGIQVVEPNKNLAEAYLKKAEESLEDMRMVKTRDWKIATAYYTMYFSVYAVLMRLGVKSEIHSCTIEFMKRFLSDYFSERECELLEDAFNARIDTQYYTDREVKDETINKIIESVPDFMVKCKDILLKITERETSEIRNVLKESKE